MQPIWIFGLHGEGDLMVRTPAWGFGDLGSRSCSERQPVWPWSSHLVCALVRHLETLWCLAHTNNKYDGMVGQGSGYGDRKHQYSTKQHFSSEIRYWYRSTSSVRCWNSPGQQHWPCGSSIVLPGTCSTCYIVTASFSSPAAFPSSALAPAPERLSGSEGPKTEPRVWGSVFSINCINIVLD